MDYLPDTNIILTYIRKTKYSDKIDELFPPLSPENTAIISVVSLGEIRSLAIQNQWGKHKREKLEELLRKFVVADINIESIIIRYAEIDAYSQGKLSSKKLTSSARNMEKNDLGIAATASVLSLTLLTTDKDFSHLEDEYVKLRIVDRD